VVDREVDGEYDPEGHEVHTAPTPPEEYVPAEHGSHTACKENNDPLI
jgi:hypothetical protein